MGRMIMIKTYPFSDKVEKKDPLKSKRSFADELGKTRYYGKILNGRGGTWQDPPKREEDNKEYEDLDLIEDNNDEELDR